MAPSTRTPTRALIRAVSRLRRDWIELRSCELPCVGAAPLAVLKDDDDLRSWLEWHVNLCPTSGPLAGVMLHVTLQFSESYPLTPPKAKLHVPLSHKNVYGDWICLNILQDYCSDGPKIGDPVEVKRKDKRTTARLELWDYYRSTARVRYANGVVATVPMTSVLTEAKEGWSYAYSVASVAMQLSSFLFDDAFLDSSSRALDSTRRASIRFRCSKSGHTFADPVPCPRWMQGDDLSVECKVALLSPVAFTTLDEDELAAARTVALRASTADVKAMARNFAERGSAEAFRLALAEAGHATDVKRTSKAVSTNGAAHPTPDLSHADLAASTRDAGGSDDRDPARRPHLKKYRLPRHKQRAEIAARGSALLHASFTEYWRVQVLPNGALIALQPSGLCGRLLDSERLADKTQTPPLFVVEVDAASGRIELSERDPTNDPWWRFGEVHEGDVVMARVVRCESQQARLMLSRRCFGVVLLDDAFRRAFVPRKTAYVWEINDVLQVDDLVRVNVVRRRELDWQLTIAVDDAPSTSSGSQPTIRRAEPLAALPDEMALHVLSFLGRGDLNQIGLGGEVRLAKLCDLSVSRRFARAELVCAYSRAPYTEVILGVGCTATKHAGGGLKDVVPAVGGGLLSKEAIEAGIRGTPFKETFEHWLPLWIDNAVARKRGVALAAVTAACRIADVSTPEDPSRVFADVCLKTLNGCVVAMCSGSMHESVAALELYFQLFHLLLSVALAMPPLLATLQTRVQTFLARPECRDKRHAPSLGELLPLVPIADVAWSDAVVPILEEAFVRNARWALRAFPELADTQADFRGNVAAPHRLAKTLKANATSLRLLAFHAQVARIVREDCGSSPRRIARALSLRLGKPSRGAVAALQANTMAINRLADWSTFFAALGLPPPRPTYLAQWLRLAISTSHGRGYHNQATALRQARNKKNLRLAAQQAAEDSYTEHDDFALRS